MGVTLLIGAELEQFAVFVTMFQLTVVETKS